MTMDMRCALHSKSHTVLGSMCGATAIRRINLAYPPWAHEVLHDEQVSLDYVIDRLRTKSDSDQRAFIRRFLTSAHEACHYHHLLGSISGLQSYETSFLIFSRRLHSLHLSIGRSRDLSLPLRMEKEIYDQVKHAFNELDYFIYGRLCDKCLPGVLPDPRPVASFDSMPNVLLALTNLAYAHQVICLEDGKSHGYVGSFHLLENLAAAYEMNYCARIATPLGRSVTSVIEARGWPYNFGEILIDAVINNDYSMISVGYSLFIHRLLYIGIMASPKTPSRETDLNFAPLKFVRAVQFISKNPYVVEDSNYSEVVEKFLENEYGYATVEETRKMLARNAEERLRQIHDDRNDRHSAVGLYYLNQLKILKIGEDPLGDIIDHMAAIGRLPGPPCSIVYSNGAIPRKIITCREPVEDGATWFAFMFSWNVVDQIFSTKYITCPLKQEGIFCHRQDEGCGTVLDLHGFRNVRQCLFEKTLENVLSTDFWDDSQQILALDGVMLIFIYELLIKSAELDLD